MSRPTALYLHVPFCSRICPYCAFTVTSRFDDPVILRFMETIDAEIRFLDGGRPLPLETIYVGGGTPTVLGPKELGSLLASIAARCDRSRVREWTVEVNPETVDAAKARVLKDAGVTRVSIGAQSMQERFLRRLGRTHDPADVRNAVEVLRNAGISDLNVDLIYAQPEQAISDWMKDVEAVVELGVPHLSLYELTFEPGTPFGRGHGRGAIPRAEDSLAVAMFQAASVRLAEAGIEWYEISNFAVPGMESLHNQVYWRNEPYFGVGPGAFGCVNDTRTMNATDLAEWTSRVEASGSGIVEREPLSSRDTFVETLAAGLRTRAGVDLENLVQRTRLDVRRTHGAYLEDLRAKGLAEWGPDRLRLTLQGVLVLDSILLGFLDHDDAVQSPPRR